MSIKPILFNTNMVRGLLDNRKTVTRRVVKGYALEHLELDTDGSIIGVYDQFDGHVRPVMDYSPYRPGDILYVREAFQQNYDGSYSYRAGHKFEKSGGWRPSIHMPREAARIFLRVTDVRVERLQDITEEQAMCEGFQGEFTGTGESIGSGWEVTPTEDFAKLWDSTIKPTDRAVYGWEANPWVWVIEFERCDKPEEV